MCIFFQHWKQITAVNSWLGQLRDVMSDVDGILDELLLDHQSSSPSKSVEILDVARSKGSKLLL
jgi:hypothetical protein